MKVFLIRHAKIKNADSVVQGYDDKIIVDAPTLEGIEVIRKMISNPEKIYCSELQRAKETAKLIYPKRKDIIYTPLLNEYIRPSRLIGKSRAELVNFWEVEHKKDKYDPHWKPEDGESFYECAQRAEDFYCLLKRDAKSGINSVSVIGHGTLLRHLVCALTKVDWKNKPEIIIDLLRKFDWDLLQTKVFEI